MRAIYTPPATNNNGKTPLRKIGTLSHLQKKTLPSESHDVGAHVQLLAIKHRALPAGVEELRVPGPDGLRSVGVHEILQNKKQKQNETKTNHSLIAALPACLPGLPD